MPIEVTISVGKARPLVSELVELRRDSVLTLDSSIDDPVELYIGDRLIARGELQELGDDSGRLGVRLTEVADFSNETLMPRPGGPASRFVVALALARRLTLAVRPPSRRTSPSSLGDGESLNLRTVQLLVLLTLLSLAPGLAIMVTCFPFMVTVLSILRQAIGVQQAPPNMMIVSLALFLTWFVMEPVFREAWDDRRAPDDRRRDHARGGLRAGHRAVPRLHGDARRSRRPSPMLATRRPGAATPTARRRDRRCNCWCRPSCSREIKRGFEVGFLIFLPFLVIDLVIAAVLMSMGMMMVPPAIVSLPFKLAFFVIADGWTLLAGALVRSYAP